jgi:GAF domain-containing protein
MVEPDVVGDTSLKNIQLLIEELYSLFEANYGKSEELEERINFEVTFMTQSYIDGEITIPAYANRDRRAPISMSFRNANPTIYKNTVTALVYRDEKPMLRIIEDTEDPHTNYSELYTKQKERIKSSIIFPVLSPSNLLLGTIVIHCDKRHFFKYEDLRYWTEIIEIFSKFLGIEKIKLDVLSSSCNIRLF